MVGSTLNSQSKKEYFFSKNKKQVLNRSLIKQEKFNSWYKYVILISCLMIQAIPYGIVQNVQPLFIGDVVRAIFNAHFVIFTVMFTVGCLVSALFAPFLGKLYGKTPIKVIFVIAALVSGIAFVLLGVVQWLVQLDSNCAVVLQILIQNKNTYHLTFDGIQPINNNLAGPAIWIYFIQGILQIGNVMFSSLAVPFLINNWFDNKYRGTAMGIAFMGGSLGNFMWQTVTPIATASKTLGYVKLPLKSINFGGTTGYTSLNLYQARYFNNRISNQLIHKLLLNAKQYGYIVLKRQQTFLLKGHAWWNNVFSNNHAYLANHLVSSSTAFLQYQALWNTYFIYGLILVVFTLLIGLLLIRLPKQTASVNQFVFVPIANGSSSLAQGPGNFAVLRFPGFWILFIFVLILALGASQVGSFYPTYIEEGLHISLTTDPKGYETVLAHIGYCFATGCLIGNFLGGILYDKIGIANAILFSMFCCCFSVVLILIAPGFGNAALGVLEYQNQTVIVIMVAVLLTGFGVFACTSAIPNMAFDLFGKKDQAVNLSFLQTGFLIGLGITSPIYSSIQDSTNTCMLLNHVVMQNFFGAWVYVFVVDFIGFSGVYFSILYVKRLGFSGIKTHEHSRVKFYLNLRYLSLMRNLKKHLLNKQSLDVKTSQELKDYTTIYQKQLLGLKASNYVHLKKQLQRLNQTVLKLLAKTIQQLNKVQKQYEVTYALFKNLNKKSKTFLETKRVLKKQLIKLKTLAQHQNYLESKYLSKWKIIFRDYSNFNELYTNFSSFIKKHVLNGAVQNVVIHLNYLQNQEDCLSNKCKHKNSSFKTKKQQRISNKIAQLESKLNKLAS